MFGVKIDVCFVPKADIERIRLLKRKAAFSGAAF
jgi:hypothetical protein